MPRQDIHKRFMRLNDAMSLAGSYWYMCTKGSNVPVGIQENDEFIRPDCVHT